MTLTGSGRALTVVTTPVPRYLYVQSDASTGTVEFFSAAVENGGGSGTTRQKISCFGNFLIAAKHAADSTTVQQQRRRDGDFPRVYRA